MTNTVDISSALQQASGGSFITGPEKEELYQTQEALYIVNVEPRSETQYGDQTIYYVKSAKWGRDDQRLLAFSHNQYRERQAQGVLNLITQSGKPGGPVYLGKWKTQSGKDAWTIDAKPFDVAQHAAQATPQPAAPTQAPSVGMPTVDDDLPF